MKDRRTVWFVFALIFLVCGRAGAQSGVGRHRVLTGIDVLERDHFRPLQGAKIALVTNQTGVDRDGRRTIDVLRGAPGVTLIRLFSPEHGLYGSKDEKIADAVDDASGLPVSSLYGKTRRPTTQMLDGVDTIVFDIQDVGARFYTYTATLGLCMEEAAKHHVRVVVLDRPNPITGLAVEGPLADRGQLNFTSYAPLPVRYGLTIGELARMYNDAYGVHCRLDVIPLDGWSRALWWDQTDLKWINPSPAMTSPREALLYTGVCLLEQTNINVGRGTDTPFELMGAPWIDENKLAARLNEFALRGIQFQPIRFTPTRPKYKDESCGGVKLIVTDRENAKPVLAGVVMAWTLQRMYPTLFQYDKVDVILHNHKVLEQIKALDDPRAAEDLWNSDLKQWTAAREKYLLYH